MAGRLRAQLRVIYGLIKIESGEEVLRRSEDEFTSCRAVQSQSKPVLFSTLHGTMGFLRLAAILVALGALLTVPSRGEGGDESVTEGSSDGGDDCATLTFLVNK